MDRGNPTRGKRKPFDNPHTLLILRQIFIAIQAPAIWEARRQYLFYNRPPAKTNAEGSPALERRPDPLTTRGRLRQLDVLPDQKNNLASHFCLKTIDLSNGSRSIVEQSPG